MKSNFCMLLVFSFLLIYSSIFAQKTATNRDPKQSQNTTGTTKTDEQKSLPKSTENSQTGDIPEKNTRTLSDSLKDLSNRMDEIDRNVNKLSNSTEKPWFEGIGNSTVIMLIGTFCLLSLIASIVVFFSSSSKHALLNHRVNNIQKSTQSSTLTNINDPSKRQISEMNDIITQLKLELKDTKDKMTMQTEKIDELIIKYDATKSINHSVEENTRSQKQEVEKLIENQVEEDKGQFFNVEYFVESGLIKFRQTNTSTPFYIQKFKDKSLLTINETVYASTYSESIEKCFKVRGRMTGQYRNITPGNCKYDEFTKTWKLENTGEVESI